MQMIENLKKNGALSSIVRIETLNDDDYYRLYQKYSNYIDWVVYQIYDEIESDLHDAKSLEDRLIYLATNFYNQGNLLSGGSFNPSDWTKVPVFTYIVATGKLILSPPYIIAGASIWTGAADTQSEADSVARVP